MSLGVRLTASPFDRLFKYLSYTLLLPKARSSSPVLGRCVVSRVCINSLLCALCLLNVALSSASVNVGVNNRTPFCSHFVDLWSAWSTQSTFVRSFDLCVWVSISFTVCTHARASKSLIMMICLECSQRSLSLLIRPVSSRGDSRVGDCWLWLTVCLLSSVKPASVSLKVQSFTPPSFMRMYNWVQIEKWVEYSLSLESSLG